MADNDIMFRIAANADQSAREFTRAAEAARRLGKRHARRRYWYAAIITADLTASDLITADFTISALVLAFGVHSGWF